MKLSEYPITELLVSLAVFMAMFSAAKLALNRLPDGGIVGDIKKFFLLA